MGIDKKPTKRSVNIAYPLRKGSAGAFETNSTTLEAIIDDLRILLLTNHGERVIHMDFGANLRSIVFNQGPDMKQEISDAIVAAVDKWMPFLTINEIVVNSSDDDPSLDPNEVNIDIDFSVSGTVLRATTGNISVGA